MPEFPRHGRQWNPDVVTSATPVLRSFCNSQWNLALALVARALQIPKQVLIRFPVAVGEEILGLGVLSALVDCSGEAGADFHRAGFCATCHRMFERSGIRNNTNETFPNCYSPGL